MFDLDYREGKSDLIRSKKYNVSTNFGDILMPNYDVMQAQSNQNKTKISYKGKDESYAAFTNKSSS
jgi:hypothetical protein